MAICKAHVISKSGEVFSDVGDATPQNCHPRVAKHLLRMASTRAIARALRSMTNVGMTALEEIGDFGDIIDVNEDRNPKKIPQAVPKKITRTEKKETKSIPQPQKSKPNAPETQQPATQDTQNQNNGANPPQTQAAPQPGGNGNGKGKDKKPAVPQMSTAQKNAIYNLSRRRGISVEELEKMSTDAYGVKVEHLTSSDASSFIRQLQQSS